MKKPLFAIGAIAILAIAYWLISPLFIVTTVNETVKDLPNEGVGSIVMSRGDFTDGEPGHHAAGTAVLLKYTDGNYAVRFEDDFEVTNGPDLFVYFGRDGVYDKNARISNLKASKGGQNYMVPKEIDASRYDELWIWCRAFSVKFGAAKLLPS